MITYAGAEFDWHDAALNGDQQATEHLKRIGLPLVDAALPCPLPLTPSHLLAPIPSGSSPNCPSSSSSWTTLPSYTSLPSTAMIAASPGPADTMPATVLDQCKLDIQSLKRAEGLRDVISQVESGEVQRIREQYGPQHGRAALVQWASIKGAVTKRERVYRVLEADFRGDKNAFFAFFTDPEVTNESSTKAMRRKKRRRTDSNLGDYPKTAIGDVHDNLRAFRRVVEAIPRVEAIVKVEMAKDEYQDSATGEFSQDLWDQRWHGANGWEIWRALGKEYY